MSPARLALAARTDEHLAMHPARNLGHSDGGGPATNTTTMLLGFLIVFIVVFAIFILGGIVLHQIQRQRRRNANGSLVLEYDAQSGAYKGTPKMWEVWIDEHKSAGDGGWPDMRPMSVQTDRTTASENAPADQTHGHFRLRWPSPLSCLLQARPALRPTIPAENTHDTTTRTTPNTAPAPCPLPGENVQVSFMVAMPSPRHAPNVRWSKASGSTTASEADWQSREYAIATCVAPCRRPDA
ncbi:hypothetical protein OF83DRAFT_1173110 [Amylostereum chailletii]|nr:hypothetical protein OF83DRAFT_1173110 [Amylostereum chailletii]